ncbi:MAG: hypothetical protein JRI22_22760, partial [Deltaproteobacteria bacterium]|nr:hypothetical protein [Deltaproteobacteria bacterium]
MGRGEPVRALPARLNETRQVRSSGIAPPPLPEHGGVVLGDLLHDPGHGILSHLGRLGDRHDQGEPAGQGRVQGVRADVRGRVHGRDDVLQAREILAHD